jgi:hypothetical protein
MERDHLVDPSCRWEDNIKMDLQEVAREGMGCIDLARDRGRWQALVNGVMNRLASEERLCFVE